MKQRFSSLDVKVIAHELSEALVTLRLSNIYDLNSKILLLKFAKPDNKKQLLIESGFRCHLTEFARTTAAAPSPFVARLRKFLKTRRCTSVSQIGTDRIIEFQFSDGQYRLYLEFFASGNVILTDKELKILTLMRTVPEGEGQEPQKVGSTYSLDNRQNYSGIPPLTKERLRNALKTTVEKAAAPQPTGKKGKKKPGEDLRRGLATTITELPPMLVEHAFKVTNFDSTSSPSDILENEDLLDALFHSLEKARSIVEEVTSAPTSKGYIIAKRRSGATKSETAEGSEDKTKDLMYEDFHPFLPKQFAEESPEYKVLTFDGFNKTVDEFFSSLEGQRLESKLTEREAAAKRKLDAARQDQAKRLEGLQEAQLLNERKAAAIEANAERVQEAMDAVNGLLQQGMDWVDINKLVEREKKMGNPVAQIIKLPMNLAENIITLDIGEEEEDEEEGPDFNYETDSDVSDDDEYAATEDGKPKPAEKRLEVDIKLGISPWANAREYYDQKRTAAVKHEKTLQQSTIALKNAEHKIGEDLKKGLKQEKAILQPVRRQMWFEKFIWFISSDGYLVLGGRDATQNEMIYKRYLRKGDVYVHADLHGASSVIIKNNPKTPDAPIPPSTLSQAGTMSVCSSSAWESRAGMSAWWVRAEQVSKSAPTGQFLPTGSFMVRGEKNFLPPAQLILGFALMFRLSEESTAKHVKHRIYEGVESKGKGADDGAEADQADEGSDSGSDSGDDDVESQQRSNPLQSTEAHDAEDHQEGDQGTHQETSDPPSEKLADLDIVDNAQTEDKPAEQEDEQDDHDDEAEEDDSSPAHTSSPQTASGTHTPSTQQKKTPLPRGKRSKAKKLAAKYKYEDEEDRALREALTGTAVARRRAEEEAAAKAARAAEAAAALERKKQAEERRLRQAAEHEEVRRVMLEEGVEVLDEAEADQVGIVDGLVGTPLPGDEILEIVPVCAPWSALGKCKYKAKMQPGSQKKGKAVKEIVERWRAAALKKGVVDETAQDPERMWPREVELIKGLKTEEAYNCVPVRTVRVMLAGGSAGAAKGGGGGGKSGGSGKNGKSGGGKQRGQKR
ncbi:hypothetical protein BR93DRAFT_958574 [Coniochaeta sp. PMI_546]|nr:hypothetical protein BR93DRAFT_958574 [Coniochaeta sp. PMI_546]